MTTYTNPVETARFHSLLRVIQKPVLEPIMYLQILLLPLMLAGRVGMVEDVAADLAHGHVPRLFNEMGGHAEWKHNRKKLVARVVLGAVVASAAIVYLRSRRED